MSNPPYDLNIPMELDAARWVLEQVTAGNPVHPDSRRQAVCAMLLDIDRRLAGLNAKSEDNRG
jgi:hypothetical protein